MRTQMPIAFSLGREYRAQIRIIAQNKLSYLWGAHALIDENAIDLPITFGFENLGACVYQVFFQKN